MNPIKREWEWSSGKKNLGVGSRKKDHSSLGAKAACILLGTPVLGWEWQQWPWDIPTCYSICTWQPPPRLCHKEIILNDLLEGGLPGCVRWTPMFACLVFCSRHFRWLCQNPHGNKSLLCLSAWLFTSKQVWPDDGLRAFPLFPLGQQVVPSPG